MSDYPEIVRDLIDRIPALRELRVGGYSRIEAEEAIGNAIDAAIDAYLADCEEVKMTGGAP